ncbi:MAG: hypothetical protein H0U22_14685 [Geodermatophilaceae bacterium]|nr:hypothetical protein [Geodermatophilaceae bacterium]
MGMQSDPSESVSGPEPRDEDSSLDGHQSLVIPVPATEPDVDVWQGPEAFPRDAGSGAPDQEAFLAPPFDIDDRLDGSRTIAFSDGSRLVISFQALIDWISGTAARVKLTSRTVRQNPGNTTYSLSTTFRFTFITKKLGRTSPPIDMFPMEDSWPVYGLNVLKATTKWGHYGPGAAFAARANNVYLPFSGAHLIDATGEPRDNPLQQFTVWAIGGFAGRQQFATAAKSAIRGGS